MNHRLLACLAALLSLSPTSPLSADPPSDGMKAEKPAGIVLIAHGWDDLSCPFFGRV